MRITRKGLLAAGIALAVAPSAAADPPGDNDLAWLRLLLTVELLKRDFYSTAAGARLFAGPGQYALKQAYVNEVQHGQTLAGYLTGAGQTPPTVGDIDFTYPRGTFATRGAIARTAVGLEGIALGAYLGAVDAAQAASLRLPFARIAANEAEHLSVFAAERGRKPFSTAFPAPLSIDQASNLLGRYTS